MNPSRAQLPARRLCVALLALLVFVLAAPSAQAATPAASTAIQAAQSGGTPPDNPPLTCTPNSFTRFCIKTASSCTTTGGVRTCTFATALCTILLSSTPRCVTASIVCTFGAHAGRICRPAITVTSDGRESGAIPHLAVDDVSPPPPPAAPAATPAAPHAPVSVPKNPTLPWMSSLARATTATSAAKAAVAERLRARLVSSTGSPAIGPGTLASAGTTGAPSARMGVTVGVLLLLVALAGTFLGVRRPRRNR